MLLDYTPRLDIVLDLPAPIAVIEICVLVICLLYFLSKIIKLDNRASYYISV